MSDFCRFGACHLQITNIQILCCAQTQTAELYRSSHIQQQQGRLTALRCHNDDHSNNIQPVE